MRSTWISTGWENVERHSSKDAFPRDSEYLCRNCPARKCGCSPAAVMSLARPSASTMSCPPSAESRAKLTAAVRRMSLTFAVLGWLKISIVGSCQANQTGTLCGRPSGRTVHSQMIGSADSRWAM